MHKWLAEVVDLGGDLQVGIEEWAVDGEGLTVLRTAHMVAESGVYGKGIVLRLLADDEVGVVMHIDARGVAGEEKQRGLVLAAEVDVRSGAVVDAMEIGKGDGGKRRTDVCVPVYVCGDGSVGGVGRVPQDGLKAEKNIPRVPCDAGRTRDGTGGEGLRLQLQHEPRVDGDLDRLVQTIL